MLIILVSFSTYSYVFHLSLSIYVYPWNSCHLKYQSISPKMISYITHSTSKVPPGSRLSDPIAHAAGFFLLNGDLEAESHQVFLTHFKYHFNWQMSYENIRTYMKWGGFHMISPSLAGFGLQRKE